jgi:cell division transport system permease protein
MLAAFQTFATFSQITTDYEIALGDEYAIVLASKKTLELSDIPRVSPQAVALEAIDSALILDEVKDALSETNLAYLKTSLPRFYSLRLSAYPSIAERENIEEQLLKNDSIVRVETFAKTQDKIYRLLLLIKTILAALAALMFIAAILLIVRQMEVWRFEHSKRINIMAIFGAPLLLRSASLFRLAIADSFLASLVVGGLFYLLSADSTVGRLLNEAGLSGVRYDPIVSSLTLFGAALAIALSGVLFVILKAEETQ